MDQNEDSDRKKLAMQTYLTNAKNGIFKALVLAMGNGISKASFLGRLEDYITRIKNDPSQPKERKRIRSGKKYHTRTKQ